MKYHIVYTHHHQQQQQQQLRRPMRQPPRRAGCAFLGPDMQLRVVVVVVVNYCEK